VGQFNDVVADYALKNLAGLPGKPEVWAVGERVHARLTDAGVPLMGLFSVPNSVQAITPLVGQIQIESEVRRAKGEYARLYIFPIARSRERFTNPSASVYCRSTRRGKKVSLKLNGRQSCCPKSCATTP
jgi:hypothetical protein